MNNLPIATAVYEPEYTWATNLTYHQGKTRYKEIFPEDRGRENYWIACCGVVLATSQRDFRPDRKVNCLRCLND